MGSGSCSIVISMRQYAIIIIRSRSCSVGITVNTFFVSRNTTLAPPRDEDGVGFTGCATWFLVTKIYS